MIKKRYLTKDDIRLLKRSFRYVSRYKYKLCILLFLIILTILLGIVQPIFWGEIVQDLSDKRYNTIFFNIIYIFIINISESAVTFIKGYFESVLNNNIIFDLKCDMYRKILNLSMSTLEKMKIGELISRLQGDISILASAVTDQLITVIVNIIKVVIIGIIIFRINIILSLIVLVMFPLTYIIFSISGKKLRKESKEIKKLNDIYFSIVQESFLGIKHIKTYGIKTKNYSIFSKAAAEIKNKEIYISFVQVISQAFSRILNSFNDAIIIGLSIFFILNGKLSIQYFVAFSSYSSQFSFSLLSITKLNSNVQQILISLERIFAILDNLDYSSESYGDNHVEKVKGDIEFKNVHFAYEKDKEILKDISFKIYSNKLTSIVGKNGSGKTTIINLILGLYKVTKGKITIDGIDIHEFNEKSLRDNISVVHQQPFLFNLSIKDNLRLAGQDISDFQIEQVCKKVLIHDYIMSLEKKYDTILSENGGNLSGGQKQRLALAMCILRDTSIILLDEATSALDTESKNSIFNILKDTAKSKTVVVITHSIPTIFNSDEIIIIEEGRKVGQGSHNFLKNNNYIKLYQKELNLINESYEGVTAYER